MSYLERAAHISLIVASVIASAVLLRDHLQSRSSAAVRQLDGSVISLPGVEWPPQRRTVVLAISSRCRFCKDSAGFYHSLTTNRGPGDFQVVVLSRDPAGEIDTFLTGNGITVDRTIHDWPSRIGIAGTPTLLIVEPDGRVRNSFVGLLAPGEENKIRGILLQTPGGVSQLVKAKRNAH